MLAGDPKPLRPGRLDVHATTSVSVTITEGRYHQVRRMFAALGNHVEALHRDRLGGLALPRDLVAGTYRILDADSITAIFQADPVHSLNPNKDDSDRNRV